MTQQENLEKVARAIFSANTGTEHYERHHPAFEYERDYWEVLARAAIEADCGPTPVSSVSGFTPIQNRHLALAKELVKGNGFNHPDLKGDDMRLVGFRVPAEVAGLSPALFALETIRAAVVNVVDDWVVEGSPVSSSGDHITPQMLRDTAAWCQSENELRETLKRAAEALEASPASKPGGRSAVLQDAKAAVGALLDVNDMSEYQQGILDAEAAVQALIGSAPPVSNAEPPLRAVLLEIAGDRLLDETWPEAYWRVVGKAQDVLRLNPTPAPNLEG